jgi:Fe2+ transport system protein FeoA
MKNNLSKKKNLADLKNGQSGIIKKFTKEEEAFRLIEMGIFPGVEISVVFSSFLGGLLYINYDKGKSNLLLNKSQAKSILIN